MAATKLEKFFEYNIETYNMFNTDDVKGYDLARLGNIGGRNTDFFTQRILPTTGITGFEVLNVQLPLIYNHVNDTNNRLDLLYTGNPYSIQITKGRYNFVSLATEIQNNLIQNISTGWHVNYNGEKYTVSHDTLSYSIVSTSTCKLLIGLDVTNVIINNSTTILPNLPKLEPFDNFYIRSTVLSQFLNIPNKLNGENSNCILSIPNIGSNGMLTYNSDKKSRQTFSKIRTIHGFDISLTDSRGNNVNINNQPWSVTILFYYILSPPKSSALISGNK
jgi:hypothetical protein